jgi:hypothetical protein
MAEEAMERHRMDVASVLANLQPPGPGRRVVPSAVADLAAGQDALWVATRTGLVRIDTHRLR